jgi:hypothetical protein
MRVISQDGLIDVPYEQAALFIDYECVMCELANGNKQRVIAIYTSIEKAVKAMEMCREKFDECVFGTGGPMATADYYVPPFGFIPPKIFRFPSDDEVKV